MWTTAVFPCAVCARYCWRFSDGSPGQSCSNWRTRDRSTERSVIFLWRRSFVVAINTGEGHPFRTSLQKQRVTAVASRVDAKRSRRQILHLSVGRAGREGVGCGNTLCGSKGENNSNAKTKWTSLESLRANEWWTVIIIVVVAITLGITITSVPVVVSASRIDRHCYHTIAPSATKNVWQANFVDQFKPDAMDSS